MSQCRNVAMSQFHRESCKTNALCHLMPQEFDWKQHCDGPILLWADNEQYGKLSWNKAGRKATTLDAAFADYVAGIDCLFGSVTVQPISRRAQGTYNEHKRRTADSTHISCHGNNYGNLRVKKQVQDVFCGSWYPGKPKSVYIARVEAVEALVRGGRSWTQKQFNAIDPNYVFVMHLFFNPSRWPRQVEALISKARYLSPAITKDWEDHHHTDHDSFWDNAHQTLLNNEVSMGLGLIVSLTQARKLAKKYEQMSVYGWLYLAALADGSSIKYAGEAHGPGATSDVRTKTQAGKTRGAGTAAGCSAWQHIARSIDSTEQSSKGESNMQINVSITQGLGATWKSLHAELARRQDLVPAGDHVDYIDCGVGVGGVLKGALASIKGKVVAYEINASALGECRNLVRGWAKRQPDLYMDALRRLRFVPFSFTDRSLAEVSSAHTVCVSTYKPGSEPPILDDRSDVVVMGADIRYHQGWASAVLTEQLGFNHMDSAGKWEVFERDITPPPLPPPSTAPPPPSPPSTPSVVDGTLDVWRQYSEEQLREMPWDNRIHKPYYAATQAAAMAEQMALPGNAARGFGASRTERGQREEPRPQHDGSTGGGVTEMDECDEDETRCHPIPSPAATQEGTPHCTAYPSHRLTRQTIL